MAEKSRKPHLDESSGHPYQRISSLPCLWAEPESSYEFFSPSAPPGPPALSGHATAALHSANSYGAHPAPSNPLNCPHWSHFRLFKKSFPTNATDLLTLSLLP